MDQQLILMVASLVLPAAVYSSKCGGGLTSVALNYKQLHKTSKNSRV
jgi:hypothetical protein